MSAKLKKKSVEVVTMTKKDMELLVRLNKYTTEYCALEREKEAYYIANVRDISRSVIQSLYLQQAYIDTKIKQIICIVRRLNRNQVDFDNEIATMLFNQYDSNIRRGLSPLL